MLYIAIHVVIGYYNCAKYLCPGDQEGSWVLEFTDEDTGQRMIKDNGKIMTKKAWEEQQNNSQRTR